MSHIGTSPPSGVKRIVHRVDAAVAGRRGGRRPERRLRDAEADFLALHVAAGLPVACGLLITPRAANFGLPDCSAQ